MPPPCERKERLIDGYIILVPRDHDPGVWSAPRIATSDKTPFSEHAQGIRFVFLAESDLSDLTGSRSAILGAAPRDRLILLITIAITDRTGLHSVPARVH